MTAAAAPAAPAFAPCWPSLGKRWGPLLPSQLTFGPSGQQRCRKQVMVSRNNSMFRYWSNCPWLVINGLPSTEQRASACSCWEGLWGGHRQQGELTADHASRKDWPGGNQGSCWPGRHLLPWCFCQAVWHLWVTPIQCGQLLQASAGSSPVLWWHSRTSAPYNPR